LKLPNFNSGTSPVFIRAGWLIDGTGASVREDVILEISGELIISLSEGGFSDNGEYPIIDYSDSTIIPGLVDSHVHIAMSGDVNPEIRKKQLDASLDDSKETISSNLDKHIQSGIIAVRDGGDREGHALRYKQHHLPENYPVILKSPGRAWHAPGCYGRFIGRAPDKGKSLAESILSDHENIDHVKIINSGINSLVFYGKETPPQFGPDELRAALRVAGSLGLKAMIHANGKEAVRMAIESGCHSIEHGFFMGDENLKRLSDSGIAWVPTLSAVEAYLRVFQKDSLEADTAKRTLENQMKQVSHAAESGIEIAAGTDSGSICVNHGVSLKDEMRLLISAGLGLEKAIKCVSYNGAKLMGIESELGRLAPGMKATFVVVRGRPQGLPDSLENPYAILVNGEFYGSSQPISSPLSSKDT
jgi:imidazolonepropionase-like amidohydrolase